MALFCFREELTDYMEQKGSSSMALTTRPAQPPATKCRRGFFFLLASLLEDMMKECLVGVVSLELFC